MREEKEQGITLIALVITIIILIILATVTLNVVLGEGGLIERARQAKDLTEQATLKEQEELNTLMDEYTNIMAEDNQQLVIEIILNPTTLELIEGETSKLTATIVPDNATNKIIEWDSNNTEIVQVGQDGTVTAISDGNAIITARTTDGSNIQATCNVTVNKQLKEGDYVTYIDGTGISRLCAVLYDNSSEYGTQIITMDIVENIEIGNGKSGYDGSSTEYFNIAMEKYNNAINTFNTRAEAYNNSIYSSSARCVGSVPNNPSSESGYLTITEFTSKYSGKLRDRDINYETDFNQMGKLGIRDIDIEYWLASRDIDKGSYFGFYVRYINSSIGYDARESVCDIRANDTVASYGGNNIGLRPVFILKSEVKITGGNGTKESPYTLGI